MKIEIGDIIVERDKNTKEIFSISYVTKLYRRYFKSNLYSIRYGKMDLEESFDSFRIDGENVNYYYTHIKIKKV